MKRTRSILGALCLVAVLGAASVANAQGLTLPYGAQCSNPGFGCFQLQQLDTGPNSTAIWGTNPGNGFALRGTLIGAANTFGNAIFADAGSTDGNGLWARAGGAGMGVFAQAVSGRAVRASSLVGDGVEASTGSTGRSAVYAHNDSGGGWGVYALASGTGNALFATNPSSTGWAVYADGKLYATAGVKPGGGDWTASSDARLKKNIQPLDGAVAKMLSLKGVTYEWIDPKSQGNLTGRQTGFIAQDVEKVFPDWVGKDEKGMKTITIRGFQAITVEAMRTLVQENELLKARVSRLEQRPIVSSMLSGGLNLATAFGVAVGLGYLIVQRRRQRTSQ